MTRRQTVKKGRGGAADNQPDRLTYEQIEALTRELTTRHDVTGRLAEILLILADEIAECCKEYTHVELIARTLGEALYAASDECAAARQGFIEHLRSEVKGGAR